MTSANQPSKKQSSKKKTKLPYQDASYGIRLHKALAEAGVGSRRACEKLIEEQRVTINGITVDFMPVWTDPTKDRICVDDHPIKKPGATQRSKTYLMLNKPRGVICTNDDPEGRRRIIDMVPHKQRLFCIGRLDIESNGLVLLTDDGELAHKLTHPKFQVPKTYRVTIKGHLANEQIEKLKGGILLPQRWRGDVHMSGKKTPTKATATSVELLKRDRERTTFLITLTEGRNREIRRILARLGFPVKRLSRIGLGPIQLKGISSGDWRLLTRQEIQILRNVARRAERQVDNPDPEATAALGHQRSTRPARKKVVTKKTTGRTGSSNKRTNTRNSSSRTEAARKRNNAKRRSSY